MRKRQQPTIEERRALREKVLNGEMAMGEGIRALRKQMGLTQPNFARLVGVYPRVLLEIENGNANPTVETLNKILAVFGLQVGITRKPGYVTPAAPQNFRAS